MVSEMSSVTEAEAAAGYIKPVLANNEVKKNNNFAQISS